METATVAVASFRGNQLVACTASDVSRAWPRSVGPSESPAWTIEQMVLYVIGDAILAFEDADLEKSELGSDLNKLTAVLAATSTLVSTNGDSTDAELRAFAKNLKWPPAALVSDVKAGRLVRVQDCEFQDRPAIAGCIVESADQPGAGDDEAASLGWGVSRRLFEPAELAREMKRCLQLSGKWITERSVNPTAARRAASAPTTEGTIRDLEVRALRARASYMRANATREANAECRAFVDCVAQIPSVRDLEPGEYSQRGRACAAGKTAGCKGVEEELGRTRAENYAAQAELEAARGSLNGR